jgi:peptidyl-prolyl cis-trans isomerase SurA
VSAGRVTWMVLSLTCASSLPLGVARADTIERVVATVNDDAIFLSELRRRSAPLIEHLASQGGDKDTKDRLKQVYEHILRQLVDEELIEQTARKMSVTVSNLDVDQAIENVRKQNSLTAEQFWQAVQGQGFTEKQYREDVRKQLLRLKVVNQRVRSRVNISDETIKDEYDQRVRDARRRQRFRAAHVFTPLLPTATATEVQASMKAARELRTTLTSPAVFDTALAKSGGGDLGWLDQGDLPEELETVLLGLEPGQISEPVRSQSGVHIFLLRERQAGSAQLPPYEQAKEDIYRELLDKGMLRQQEVFLTELRRAAVIDLKL